MTEKFNLTVAQMLATFVKGNRQDWDEHLPYLMLAYRSTLHESTRCSPNMMVFGRDLALPIDVILGTPQSSMLVKPFGRLPPHRNAYTSCRAWVQCGTVGVLLVSACCIH